MTRTYPAERRPVRTAPLAALGAAIVLALALAAPADAQTQLAEGTEPTWSPDGTRILYSVLVDAAQRDLYVMRPDGTGSRAVTSSPESEMLPRWSTAGVAFVMPDASGAIRLLVRPSLEAEARAVDTGALAPSFAAAPWAPDGTALTVVAGDYPELDVYRVPLDGAEPTALVTGDGYDAQPAWSPDGRLAFVSDRGGSRDVWVMNADGTEVRRLTDHEGRDEAPAWSPDGTRIAFVSDRTGNREIHVVHVDDPGAVTRVTDDPGWSHAPAWSPDGTRLLYVIVSEGRSNDRIFITDAPAH